MNFPFHLSAGGSQISMLIRESDVGLSTSCTRQCAGISAGACCGLAPPRPPARAGAGPSGTICALVMVALSSLILARLSHVVVDAAALRSMRAKLAIMAILLRT